MRRAADRQRSPTLRRAGLALAALGLAFVGALLVLAERSVGWGLIALGLPLSGLLALAGDALGAGFTGAVRRRARALAVQTRPWMWLVALYAALKIPVPLWAEGFPLLGLLSTAALFLAALAFVWERENAARALVMAALAFGLGWGVEVLGSRTGFPFGQYSYATAPSPRLAGVPLIVPLGWFALTLAATLLSRGRVWLAGLLLALWDVGLEPLMTAQRYWLWSDPRPLWAGAPLQNFLAWWAVGSGLAWLMTRLAPGLFGLWGTGWGLRPLGALAGFWRPSAVPRLSLLPGQQPRSQADFSVVYAIEAFFLPGGLLLLGRWPEAAVTLAAMLIGLAVARLLRGQAGRGRDGRGRDGAARHA